MRRIFFLVAVLIGAFFIFDSVFAGMSFGPTVVINEVCWMGGSDNPNHEWIELKNLLDVPIDLSGWILHAKDETPQINLSGQIEGGGFYLLERTSDESVASVSADKIYSGALGNEGEELELLDNIGIVNDSFSMLPWVAGDNENKFTMERIDAEISGDVSSNWKNSNFSGGTPRAENSKIIVENKNPQAIINYLSSTNTSSAPLDEEIYFDGSSSYDEDGQILSWLWNFSDGFFANTQTVVHGFNSTGTMQVSLTVTDNLGATSTNTIWLDIFSWPITPTSSPSSTEGETSSTPFCDLLNIKINEVMSDPPLGNEWVELFNLGTKCDLNNALICDNTLSSCKIASGTIENNGFLVIDLNTNRYLNNDGDSVILRNNLGVEFDKIIYGGESGVGIMSGNQTLARKIDGVDSDNNLDWEITTLPTKGFANNIQKPITNSTSGGSSSSGNNLSSNNYGVCVDVGSLIIYEIFPNPIGSDEDEYIKIKNNRSSAIDLDGFKLKDSSRIFNLSGQIKPQEILTYAHVSSSLSLNNSKEELSILDACGKTIDKISYEKAEENYIFIRGENNLMHWINLSATSSVKETGGDPEDADFFWKINYPTVAIKGEKNKFDAGLSADPRGGELNFSWQFGSSTLFGNFVEWSFATSGLQNFLVQASSSVGTRAQKLFSVNILERLNSVFKEIKIIEVFPNPVGADKGEYIKIKNFSTNKFDVSGFVLKYQNKSYKIPSSTFMDASSSLKFFGEVTKFSLGNAGGLVELYDKDGYLADRFEFKKTKEGEIVKDEVVSVPVLATKLKTGDYYRNLTIKEIRENGKSGDKVITRGTVAVLPNIFGTQYFYIIDGSYGVQVYEFNKKFPELKVGDKVEVWGEISEVGLLKRIKVKTPSKIRVLGAGEIGAVGKYKISDLAEDNFGSLLKVSGIITQSKSSYIYLDDDSEEVKVYFKPGAKITARNFVVGEEVEVVGIYEASTNDVRLYPRFPDDVNITKTLSSTIPLANNNSKDYLLATGGGLTALLFGFMARSRGAIVGGIVKKVASSIVNTFTKRG